MRRGDRVAMAWLIAVVLPGAFAVIFEFVYQSRNPGGDYDGLFPVVFAMYFAGFALWSLLRLVATAGTALGLALGVVVLGMPFGVAVSLGIWALLLPLAALGGIVASVIYGRDHQYFGLRHGR